MAEEELDAFAADWTGADQLMPQIVNQVMSQVGLPVAGEPDGVYLTFGVATPPVVHGAPHVQAEQLAAYNNRIKISPVARLRLSRDHAVEVIRVLQTAIDQHDQTIGVYKAAYLAEQEQQAGG